MPSKSAFCILFWRLAFVCLVLLQTVSSFLPGRRSPHFVKVTNVPRIEQTTSFASFPSTRRSGSNAANLYEDFSALLQLRMGSENNEESSDGNNGVIELAEDDEDEQSKPASTSTAAPFLSQGEILPETLNPDLNDPKQTRVIIYIILSLIPVLFLIPLILGSRDLIPLDQLPPVEM